MERFPLKSSIPKMTSTYQSVYKKGPSATNGGAGAVHFGSGGEDDMVDIAPVALSASTGGSQQVGDTTPTSHGTFQLYEHGGNRNSTGSATSYVAQYFSSSAGKPKNDKSM